MAPLAPTTTAEGVDLEALTRSLRRADPDIRDIVLFGSMAYAPDLARDVDVLVTTHKRKDADLYWDAVVNFPREVDVLVREPSEPVSDGIAASICAWRASVYGNGETYREATDTMAVPTFDDVRAIFPNGDKMLKSAQEETNPPTKDHAYRTAFQTLFDVARNAAQAFLNTESSRWGQLRRSLPDPHDEEFRTFANTLHVQYAYDGRYPKDRADEEYSVWREQVVRFVDDLEAALAAGDETEDQAADDVAP